MPTSNLCNIATVKEKVPLKNHLNGILHWFWPSWFHKTIVLVYVCLAEKKFISTSHLVSLMFLNKPAHSVFLYWQFFSEAMILTRISNFFWRKSFKNFSGKQSLKSWFSLFCLLASKEDSAKLYYTTSIKELN